MYNHSLDTYLTAAIELKLHESIKLKWTEYNSENETTPQFTELLEFLDIKARHHESVAQTTRKVTTSACERKVGPRGSYDARPENTVRAWHVKGNVIRYILVQNSMKCRAKKDGL